MQVRDGPAAVRGDALAPTRHWPPGWEGGAGGSPESEDLPLAARPEPLAEGGFVLRRHSFSSRPCGGPARRPARPAPRASTCASKARRRRSSARPRRVVDARERARGARRGQPRRRVLLPRPTTSFGPYVDQVGRYPAPVDGWVFKVNGVSPPVGADQVELKDGDTVLWYWAQFGDAGGPKTLAARARRRRRCYRVSRRTTRASATRRGRRRAARRTAGQSRRRARRRPASAASASTAGSSARRSPARSARTRSREALALARPRSSRSLRAAAAATGTAAARRSG